MLKWWQKKSKGESMGATPAPIPAPPPSPTPPPSPHAPHAKSLSLLPGTPGKFRSALNDNGAPIAPVAGWTWTANDLMIQVTQDISDPTGATVDVLAPASYAGTGFNLTASTTDPNGQPCTGTESVTVGVVHVYTVTIQQLA